MTEVPFHFAGVLDCLNKHGVSYIVIGGIAANLLGSPTVTDDVDICYERSDGNLRKLARALRAMDARLRGKGVPEDLPFLLDEETLRAGDSFTFATDYGALDCLGTPSGTRGYKELAANAVEMDAGGIRVKVVAIDDLIRMKHAAGRPKDRVELEILGALREELEKRGEI